MRTSTENRPPWFHRLQVRINKWFGREFVPENFVRVIYRDERYYDVRGPGFVPVKSWRERPGELVDIGPHFATLDFIGLPTRQVVQIGLRIYFGYSFDPREANREIAMQLVKLNQEVFQALVHRYILRALLRIVPDYSVEQIGRAQVFDLIERRLEELVPKRLAILGMKLFPGIDVLGVILPPGLSTQYEQAKQLGINIETVQSYQPSQVAQGLAAEVVQKLNLQAADGQYVSLGDAFSTFKENASPLPSESTKIIEHQPNPGSVSPATDSPPPHPPGDYLDDDTW